MSEKEYKTDISHKLHKDRIRSFPFHFSLVTSISINSQIPKEFLNIFTVGNRIISENLEKSSFRITSQQYDNNSSDNWCVIYGMNEDQHPFCIQEFKNAYDELNFRLTRLCMNHSKNMFKNNIDFFYSYLYDTLGLINNENKFKRLRHLSGHTLKHRGTSLEANPIH